MRSMAMLGITMLVAVGCAHAPAPVPAPVAVTAAEDTRPWTCTSEGVCHRGEASAQAAVVPPPVSNAEAHKEGWVEVSPGQPAQPTDWYKALSPQAKLAVDIATFVAHNAR